MEKTKRKTTPIKDSNEIKYFKNYGIKRSDLKSLCQGIDTVAKSKLIETRVLDNIRFVTYDSKNFYILTRGEHASNAKFKIEEISSLSKTGFRIFKVSHSKRVGENKEDYRGARAWLLADEIETTSVNTNKFPNENILYQPDLPQPKEILDVVSIPPLEPYEKIHQGYFNYLTDVIFHEAGHIEQRRLENWQTGEGRIKSFPSVNQERKFLEVIQKTKIFPERATAIIIKNITKRAIQEMYPMIIDHEAAKKYDKQKFNSDNQEFKKTLANIRSEPMSHKLQKRFEETLKNEYTTGRFLVRILEEQIPDFAERKKFIRSVLERHSKTRQKKTAIRTLRLK